ncbi:YolD-like family protein [Fictibacillus fluitans]|uniref:YolD-like family protein n=1 Tax=Fictibacillus fluitans TaxID=3058422 RepID=A0ABT8HYA0_9BACL|nr:YolD-like family protein [Fictibacillus sp. NE201]MDN4525227.1 YolD-like family protein [Fictibacillus sp. NE201]
MIKDRGSLKWTSMMLPEHVKQLREWEQEDTGAADEGHEWDEQLMEEMNRQILFAMEEAARVEINCRSGAFAGKQVRGCIYYYDPYRRMLRMVDDEGGRQDVFLQAVADITLL